MFVKWNLFLMFALLMCCLLAFCCQSPLLADEQTGKWGDQGDGTYRNPIIAADYSDPDVIRVGNDYYMVALTFESSPGITVLHSRDLVNWDTLCGVFEDMSKVGPEFDYTKMARYGEGLFAPSIRFHDGKFYIFVNSHSGEGFYCATAVNPTGPWTVTQIKDKNGKPLRTNGWTDPCPFWDDDGKAYLASSRPGAKWYSYLFQMSPDGSQLLDADVDKMNVSGAAYAFPDCGTLFSPFHSSEGNKIYKRNGYYYLLHIEFLNSGHGAGTYVLRSRYLYGTKPDGTPGGPGDIGQYDLYKFGSVGPDGQDIPGQGGLVDTPDGRWFWIAQFNRYGSDGRTPNLIPITWIDDWPVPGVNVVGEHGTMLWQDQKPISGESPRLPLGSDDFDSPKLSPKWLWNHQPRADAWSLSERPGWLRLHSFKPLRHDDFFSVGNTLCQRFMRSEHTTAIVKLDITGMAEGQEAGLAHFNNGKNESTIGVILTGGIKEMVYGENTNGIAQVDPVSLPPSATTLWLRTDVGFDNVNNFSYSTDGRTFVPFGGHFLLKTGKYRGDYVGIYTFDHSGEGGSVDIDWFHYTVQNR